MILPIKLIEICNIESYYWSHHHFFINLFLKFYIYIYIYNIKYIIPSKILLGKKKRPNECVKSFG